MEDLLIRRIWSKTMKWFIFLILLMLTITTRANDAWANKDNNIKLSPEESRLYYTPKRHLMNERNFLENRINNPGLTQRQCYWYWRLSRFLNNSGDYNVPLPCYNKSREK